MDYSQIQGFWQMLALIIVVVVAPNIKAIVAYIAKKLKNKEQDDTHAIVHKLELDMLLKYSPNEEDDILDLWEHCQKKHNMNGRMKRKMEQWKADHYAFACPVQAKRIKKTI
jgi:hypothetical protein